MFDGNFDIAMKYALMLRDEIDDKLLDMPELNIEWYYSIWFHVYIRFGKWDEIISEKIIENEKLPLGKIIQRYARTIAFAVKGNVTESKKELDLFEKFKKNLPENSIMGNNKAHQVLEVGHQMALGELLYRKKDYQKGFNHLRKSVELSDNLNFSEPWDWMQPPRHALGALLLEQDYIEESIEVYLKDLNKFKDNIWSLVGLEECYSKLKLKFFEYKLNNIEEIDICEKLLKVNEKISRHNTESEKKIKSSCFCKKNSYC